LHSDVLPSESTQKLAPDSDEVYGHFPGQSELTQVTHTLGDRRDFFLAPHDPWEVIRIVVEGRKRREIDPTLAFLRDCATTLQKDSETPPEVRERIVAQMEFFETLTVWYDSIKNLPRKTLMKMMRLGQKIVKVIGE
jgi:DNA-binding transcriptional regulator GbsR (MarR family)